MLTNPACNMNQQPTIYSPMLPAQDLPLQAPDLGSTVDNIWQIVWRRRWQCLSMFACVALLGTVFLIAQTPRYTAHTIMTVSSRDPDLATTDKVAPVARASSDREPEIESEIQLMLSNQALAKIVHDLGLDHENDLQRPVWDSGKLAMLHTLWIALIDGDIEKLQDGLKGTPHASPVNPIDAIVESLKKSVKIEQLGRSGTVDISFTARDPALAARITNTIADAYIENRHAARRFEAERAASFLRTRSAALRQELADTERAVEDFRASSVLADGRDIDHLRAEMEKANDQLTGARVARAAAISKLEAVESRVRKYGITAALESGDAGVVTLDDRLREMTAQARAKVAGLVDLGDKQPEAQRARNQANVLQGEVVSKAEARLSKLKSDVTAADLQIEQLKSLLQTSRSNLDRLSVALITLKGLERTAGVSRAVYEALLNRIKVTEQVGFNEANGWILSRAIPAVNPSSPKIILIVGATLVLAFGAALSFALLAEHKAGRTILSAQHLIDKGLKSLGIVPDLGRRVDSMSAALATTGQTNSPFSESIAGIFTSLLELARHRSSALVFLVTSSLPFEGKSTTVIALAAKMAAAGKRVLLVDADLRAPQLHKAFGITTSRGVTDCLDPSRDLNHSIHVDQKTGISILTAGQACREPQNVLNAQRLIDAMQDWRASYDFILIDSPPVLPISDARILLPLTDYCIFVAHWRKTKWLAAMHALRLLQESGAHLAGVVVSKVDVKQLATYEFADSEIYGRAYQRYLSTHSVQ